MTASIRYRNSLNRHHTISPEDQQQEILGEGKLTTVDLEAKLAPQPQLQSGYMP